MVPDIRTTLDRYRSGKLDRDTFWNDMREAHGVLNDYRELVGGAVLEAIEVERDHLSIRLQNGLRFLWDPSDMRTAPSIVVNQGEYEPEELELLEIVSDSSRVVVDIGCNIGWYSIHLGRRLAPRGGTVYAFEPMPTTFERLLKNVSLNSLETTVQARDLGLGEQPGEVEFFIPESSGSVAASRRRLFPDVENKSVVAKITTLDRFVDRERIRGIGLVKCDVEGSELYVLRGASRTLERERPVIMLEMLRKWSALFGYHPDEIIMLLESYGYECWAVSGTLLERVDAVDEQCAHTNFFFLDPQRHASLLEEIQCALSSRTGRSAG